MRRKHNRKEKSEFDQALVDVARVARIVAGGRRFRFRATVVIGDRKGRVGMGIAKGPDVTIAVSKAVDQAKKNLIKVPIVNDTIPHEITTKYSGARVFLKPASKGTGIIAGGAVRAVVELAGIRNILSKMRGSNNKPNNVQATLLALARLTTSEKVSQRRGKEVKGEILKRAEQEDKKETKPKVEKKPKKDKK